MLVFIAKESMSRYYTFKKNLHSALYTKILYFGVQSILLKFEAKLSFFKKKDVCIFQIHFQSPR